MYLTGNLSTEYGADATYHIITEYKWDKYGSIRLTVSCFASAQAWVDQKRPLDNINVSIKRDDYLEILTEEGTLSLELLYEVLTQLSPWSDLSLIE